MEQPITLYLDLEPGDKADLATVARTALAFDEAVREIAYIIDPSINVRLEFDSGTEGSLKLNSLINTLKSKATDPATLKVIAIVVIGWFVTDLRSYLSEQAIETIIREEVQDSLSDDEIKRIAGEVAKALKGEVGEEEVKRVYQELQRDDKIKGVGVTTNPAKRPRLIVPRSEFNTRTRTVVEVEANEQEARRGTSNETVTLISPVLLSGERRWRFSLKGFEFGAAVQDHDFVETMLSGKLNVPMVAGLSMDVLLETKEEKVDGVWTVKERTILKVYGARGLPHQTNLPLSTP